jgi:hypothetical protein
VAMKTCVRVFWEASITICEYSGGRGRGGTLSVNCRFGPKKLVDCRFLWPKSCRFVDWFFGLLSKNCRFQPNFARML